LRGTKEFEILDRGFGTAYEKAIIGKIFDDLVEKYQLKTVCEFPCNDLMENNSSEFEDIGCKVTRQSLKDAEVAGKFDLVWCFCELEQQDDPSFLIKKMLDKSQRYVLIVSQNKRNLGVALHYLYHFLLRRKWDHGHIKYMTTTVFEKKLAKKNVSILLRGAFDAPWFILDVYEAGSTLLKLVPKSLLKGKIKQTEIKPSKFENLPFWIKKWLSHHVYVLIEKTCSV
jgi:hypothetical protein